MKALIPLLVLMFIAATTSCQQANRSHSNTENTIPTVSKELPKLSKEEKLKALGISLEKANSTYMETKGQVRQKLQQLKIEQASEDSISTVFTNCLVNQIIPHWYGTPWTFTGHTATPGKGEIACGYFVSTTLRDMGININRYKLAQQSPINEARTLQLKGDLLEFSGENTAEIIGKMQNELTDGIHFIGFDSSHVGFLLKIKNNLILLHSNYLDYKGVDIEFVEESDVFASYFQYYIVPLSSNKSLQNAWINNFPITVISKE